MEKQSISQIKEQYKQCEVAELTEFIRKYQSDSRAGVLKIVETAKHTMEKYEKELLRMENMKQYERKYAKYSYIAGIDEVGRGPLAGPVVACAVVLPKDCSLLYVNDSKKLSAKMRETLCEEIKQCAVSWAVGEVDHKGIDECNILQATYQAMREAIGKLEVAPDLLLNDAVTIPDITIEQVPIIKGDASSISIAAASIVAKVTRDAMMVEYDRMYPEYDFANNKGYGSAKHIAALRKYGPCPIHRETFIKGLLQE